MKLSSNLPVHHVHENNRTDLAKCMKEAWSGKTTSHIGMQYVKLVDGIVILNSTFAREDVLWLSYEGCCNVFVDLTGDNGYGYAIDTFSGVELEEQDYKNIDQAVELEMSKRLEFIQRQRDWFSQKHEHLQVINGMTPDQAVEYLVSKGW